ncbi:DUF4190 domain-containing protein [Acidimicrobiaceae bacterium USS-CC1]|uniref:DUF4190 domain-containing protein n=1 Tax=Acidiferrimicrobium australe TaxID=2664430 RepID=A0ABW9QRY6_9ACTN|nr:DUF4190 domain-containing protein [Acidiferrimicrobium australe]
MTWGDNMSSSGGQGGFPPGYSPGPGPTPQPPWGGPPEQQATNGFAIASLACSVAALLPFVGIVGAILGIVFGFVARSRIRMSGERGAGLAMAGIVVGTVMLVVAVVLLAVILGAVTTVVHNNSPGGLGAG